ncbi:MAG: tetratricopeptide repeat protein [Flavobacteriales bacterium]|nr:tetratricopeptide repeat protein [Flavobacteriales bacterium]
MRIIVILIFSLPIFCFGQELNALKKAELLYENGDYREAILLLEDIIKEDETSFEALLLQGNCFQKEEKFVAAIQSYEKAESLKEESALLNANYGAAFLNLNQFEKAKDRLKTALKLDSDLPEAHYFMGNIDYFDFKTTSALKHYSKALKLRPEYRDALYMRAAANAEMGNYDLALKDYEKVLELDPNLELAKYNMAVILITNEEYGRGIKLLGEVNPHKLPNPKDFYYYQGEALYFSGRKEESCELYAKAGEMGDSEAMDIYTKFCLSGKERKEEKPEKRVIRMAF